MSRDRVTPELRAEVFARDGMCILYRLDPAHRCFDIWGEPHSPYDLERCSLEHVKSELRMGRRAPSDRRHLVAMCGLSNVAVPSKVTRNAIREYLARVETP